MYFSGRFNALKPKTYTKPSMMIVRFRRPTVFDFNRTDKRLQTIPKSITGIRRFRNPVITFKNIIADVGKIARQVKVVFFIKLPVDTHFAFYITVSKDLGSRSRKNAGNY